VTIRSLLTYLLLAVLLLLLLLLLVLCGICVQLSACDINLVNHSNIATRRLIVLTMLKLDCMSVL